MAAPTLSELAGTREWEGEEAKEVKEGFRRPMEETPTGCGSSTFKPLAAFSEDVSRNPALSAKIDEDFSSCRTPLQVLQDVLTDKESCEAISEEGLASLRARAAELKDIAPPCACREGLDNGPYYVHLGHAPTRPALRRVFEERLGARGAALRLETIKFSGKEGKTEEECPIAKWILRRTNDEEKYMVVVKQRFGHRCDYTWTTVLIIQWDGVPRALADRAYSEIAAKTAAFGTETERQCGANRRKTCACQGLNMDFSGASYTFGCSWTMYHNICKFCRSFDVHKFKLKDESAEGGLEEVGIALANQVGAAYRTMAPDSHANMCLFEEVAADCRIGDGPGKPFSGITTVCDFCAHSHKDTNNMVGGATAIVTLLRPQDREAARPAEQQFHVLPLYVPDMSTREVEEKVARGGLEVLDKFSRTIAVREEKMAACKRGRLSQEKKRYLDSLARDAKDYTDPSLRPPGLQLSTLQEEAAMPQLDGAASDGEAEAMEATIHSLDTSLDTTNTSLDTTAEDPDLLAASMEAVKIRVRQSECLEAFSDPSIGGIALALPHGSLVIECAKAELHATTALQEPNRQEPHRIGLVFYQHKNLHHPGHGAGEFQRKRAIREFRDYVQWLKGNYVPTEAKLRAMCESGFVFPEQVKTILKPMEVGSPMDYFQFRADCKNEEASDLRAVDTRDDLEVAAGYLRWLDNAPEPDDEVDFRPLLATDEDWVAMHQDEEVRRLEEKVAREAGRL